MRLSSCLFAAALLSVSVAASAESFAFTFGSASSPFSGSGTLTTGTEEVSGEYSIIGVTGTAFTDPNGPTRTIRSILPAGTFPTFENGGSFPPNDNTLFFNTITGLGNFSQDGLSFILGNGAQINLYDDGPGNDAFLERVNGAVVNEDVPITITAVATTPEPSSLALFATGLLGVTRMVKRRRGPSESEL